MPKIKPEEKKGAPTISTASLPDVIFILLFFFMVATVLRETTMKVQIKLPKATQLQELKRKELVSHIYIGPPMRQLQGKYGTAPRIQLNDVIASKKDIADFVENERASMHKKLRPYLTIALKVDKESKMGLVSDVKQELRKANALKVNYTTLKEADE